MILLQAVKWNTYKKNITPLDIIEDCRM